MNTLKHQHFHSSFPLSSLRSNFFLRIIIVFTLSSFKIHIHSVTMIPKDCWTYVDFSHPWIFTTESLLLGSVLDSSLNYLDITFQVVWLWWVLCSLRSFMFENVCWLSLYSQNSLSVHNILGSTLLSGPCKCGWHQLVALEKSKDNPVFPLLLICIFCL